ncbi:hypothetical protein E4T50_02761 [Aureobasidium sp. EXF-12298]|nr:hypothetical protein E4T50_02761 [Aureobasidium sp. EXF-12298]
MEVVRPAGGARHLKCDETQPACVRCVRASRTCGGYRAPARPTGQLRAICPRPVSSNTGFSDLDGIALDFFRRVTLFQLPCASATETPWEKIALDLVYLQPCIAAAASACAGIHRAITDTQDHNQWRFAMQQYNKSLSLLGRYISDLRSRTTDDEVLVVLVACLLLFTYEVFSGRDEKASFHLRTGLRIIHERCCPSEKPLTRNGRHVVIVKPCPKTLLEMLVQTFVRLDSDYTLTGHDDPYLYPICEEPMPSSFSNPDEASSYLEVLSTWMFDLFDDLWLHTYCILSKQRDLDDLSTDQRNCLIRAALRTVELDDNLTDRIEQCRESLRAWNAAFSDTQQTKKNITSHISTQIFFFCICFWVETWRDTTAMDVDRFESQFAYFTDLCEQYLNLHLAKTSFRSTFTASQAKVSAQMNTPPAFSLGSGVVTCLVAVVESCRNSVIRRRCIGILQKINLRGIFNTDYLVAHLQAIVENEEKMARDCSLDVDLGSELQMSDIPEEARFLEVVMSPSYHASNFDFYKTKYVGMVFVTGGHGSESKGLQIGEKKIRVL